MVLCSRISFYLYVHKPATNIDTVQEMHPMANLPSKCNTSKMSISKGVSVAKDGWPVHQRHKDTNPHVQAGYGQAHNH